MMRSSLIYVAAALAGTIAMSATGCGVSGPGRVPAAGGQSGARFAVVVAESSWGSIAAQVAGSRAAVQSIISNPATDPHSYEPTARDARELANASVAIVNGIGYDGWATRLLAASPSSNRVVLDVGKMLGIAPPGNPHQWYSPASVGRVASRIAAAYARVDPADANYFARRARTLLTTGLARYDALRAQIRARYAGAAVGFSESIFEPLGDDLHLSLLTRAFARAITNGTDVSAADKEALDALVRERKIRVWVYNRQNVTPDVERITQIARERRIPIVAITETLSPASSTFQLWQVAQLEALLAALKSSDGQR